MDLEGIICQDHAHCAYCSQYLLGWECLRDTTGTYYCDADCAAMHENESQSD